MEFILPMSFRVHRIRILGGRPFKLYPTENPCVEHDGGTSVHTLFINEEELRSLNSSVTEMGASIQDFGSVTQTPEQTQERLALLGVGRDNTVWPSVTCLTCAWFEPVLHSPCGVKSWSPESVSSFLELNKPKLDFEFCPVSDWRDNG